MVQYYSEKQDSKADISIIKFESCQFYTSSGVFSKEKVDPGSVLLVNKCELKKAAKVLDLGCGYGPIGILLAKKYPLKEFLLTDLNERAVKLAIENKKLNKIHNVKIIKSDIYANIKSKFDVILVNLPQRAGKKICFQMIEESKKYLNLGGSLQFVAVHNKGGKSYQEKATEIFGNSKILGIKSGYRVYSFVNE